MGITHRLNCWAHEILTPVSISEADIREELECHVELRVLQNVAAGMSQEEARLDAENRFGDFEVNVRDCYRASLGLRVWLRYLQWTVFAVLLGAVLYMASSMFQMQSRYESEITSLRERLALHGVTPHVPLEKVNSMAIRQWNIPVCSESELPADVENFNSESPVSPDEAWCDWSALDDDQ
jgi:hypothetical protein